MAYPTTLTVRIPDAAALTGIARHVLVKSFMRPDRRPKGIPAPPPHVRVGRAIYILVDELPAWVASLARPNTTAPVVPKKIGAPTKAERVAKRSTIKVGG